MSAEMMSHDQELPHEFVALPNWSPRHLQKWLMIAIINSPDGQKIALDLGPSRRRQTITVRKSIIPITGVGGISRLSDDGVQIEETMAFLRVYNTVRMGIFESKFGWGSDAYTKIFNRDTVTAVGKSVTLDGMYNAIGALVVEEQLDRGERSTDGLTDLEIDVLTDIRQSSPRDLLSMMWDSRD